MELTNSLVKKIASKVKEFFMVIEVLMHFSQPATNTQLTLNCWPTLFEFPLKGYKSPSWVQISLNGSSFGFFITAEHQVSPKQSFLCLNKHLDEIIAIEVTAFFIFVGHVGESFQISRKKTGTTGNPFSQLVPIHPVFLKW